MKFLKILVICIAPISAFLCITFPLPPKPKTQETDVFDALKSCVRIKGFSVCCGTIISAHKSGNNTRFLVLSTGHIHERTSPEIQIFYSGGKRLKDTVFIMGTTRLLVQNNFDRGTDFCLIEAAVENAEIHSTPLAPDNMTPTEGDELVSAGCDGGTIPALYDVKMLEYRRNRNDLKVFGDCEGGRSGGGLFTKDGQYLVGVCWGARPEQHEILCTTHKNIRKIMKQMEIPEN